MRVLVTGGTGLLGNNVIRQLVEAGHDVRALARPRSDSRPLEGLAVEIRPGDVIHAEQVRAALEGCDGVIHSAGFVKIGRRQQETHQQVNVEGTRHVATAAGETGARMVHVSSVNALGIGRKGRPGDEAWADPGIHACPYVTTKQAAERVVLDEVQRGLRATIVNPGFMLGPWDWKPSSGDMILQVASRWTPFAPWGGLSVCDVRDVAAATIRALHADPPGQKFVLAGENMSYYRLWRIIAEVTGTRGPLCPAGPIMRYIAGYWGDFTGYLSGREPEVNSASVALSSQLHYFSSERAQRELNYRSRPARESVTDAWNWFREHQMTD